MTDLPRPRSATDVELRALRRACELAALGLGRTSPNPIVGCVVLGSDGEVAGEGFHEYAGGPHAEVVALSRAGERARGGTAIVTLEPCNHSGRTGPCSTALIAAGISRVVFAVRDPWATASGGAATLRDAGVEVVDLSADARPENARPENASTANAATENAATQNAATENARPELALAEDVNRAWLTAMRLGRPFVTLKIAMSLDGRVAAPDGSARWISSAESRADAHLMRTWIDAIMVGVGTVLADDPALTARGDDGTAGARQPLRVVADSHGRTPASAKVVAGPGESILATGERFGFGADGRVDLAALLAELHAREIRHLLVEGGPRLAASFLDLGLVDEVLVYLAPMLLGAGRSAVEGGNIESLAGARHLTLIESRRIGPDLALRYSILPPG